MSVSEKAGRPPKPIDWNLVNELLEAGCSGPEIAPHFNIHSDTLYRQVENKYGMNFTTYATSFNKKGESSIRKKQYDKALKGDNMMLIWLGKNRLKQADQHPQEITANDQRIGETLENAKLRAENAKLKELLNVTQTGTEHLRGEQETEHMVRGSSIGEDLQQHIQTD